MNGPAIIFSVRDGHITVEKVLITVDQDDAVHSAQESLDSEVQRASEEPPCEAINTHHTTADNR